MNSHQRRVWRRKYTAQQKEFLRRYMLQYRSEEEVEAGLSRTKTIEPIWRSVAQKRAARRGQRGLRGAIRGAMVERGELALRYLVSVFVHTPRIWAIVTRSNAWKRNAAHWAPLIEERVKAHHSED